MITGTPNSPSAGQYTIVLTRSTTIAKATAFSDDFAEGLRRMAWGGYPKDANGQPVAISTLNTQERLNLLEAFMVEKAMEVAKGHRIASAESAARAAANAAADNEIAL